MNCMNCENIKKVHMIRGSVYSVVSVCRDHQELTEQELTVERPWWCPIAARERDALRKALRA